MTDTLSAVGPDVDILDQLTQPAGRDDPYPIYAWLRENAPVYRSRYGAYLLSRYSDVERVLKDHETFPGAPEGAAAQMFPDAAAHPAYEVLITSLVGSNPPKHTRLKHLVAREFTSRRVNSMMRDIQQQADKLTSACVEQLQDGESIDFHGRISIGIPLHVIGELIGVPEADRRELAVKVPQMMNVVDPAASPAAVAAADAAFVELGEYFDELIALRRRNPAGDLISALIQQHDQSDDQLSTDELRTLLFTLWSAGFETTATAIDNALLALMQRYELADYFHTVDGARQVAAETLRYDASVQVAPGLRFTVAETAIADMVLPPFSQVRLLIGSANRDPAAFSDPDSFDPSRNADRASLSFGGGIHYCLGAGLSIIEVAAALDSVVKRLPRLAPAEPPGRRRSVPLRDFERLLVRAV